jgi:glycine cleavage system H protein
MEAHDFVSLYSAKAIEYLIALAYLALFVPFWRYVQGGAAEPLAAPATERPRRASSAPLFGVPDGVQLHPGHAWARSANGAVAVGLDDFAHLLVGPLAGVELPEPGTELRQGRPAFTLRVDGREVPVLSPVDGTVVERNERAAQHPGELHRDPYGEGWLFKLRSAGPSSFKQLLVGDAARAYLETCATSMGAMAADGGLPVRGFARELRPGSWDVLARQALLSSEC